MGVFRLCEDNTVTMADFAKTIGEKRKLYRPPLNPPECHVITGTAAFRGNRAQSERLVRLIIHSWRSSK